MANPHDGSLPCESRSIRGAAKARLIRAKASDGPNGFRSGTMAPGATAAHRGGSRGSPIPHTTCTTTVIVVE